MAELAIKGHKTRGRDVITFLEMLGGHNMLDCGGYYEHYYYFIDYNSLKWIYYTDTLPTDKQVYSLDEFEKTFPYKIGDTVVLEEKKIFKITDAYWESLTDDIFYNGVSIEYPYVRFSNISKDLLRPYNPEPVEPSPDKAKAPSLEGQDYSEGRCSYKIPEGFEFDKVENGEIILKPKKKALPKTYEVCCEVIGISRHDVEIDLPQPYQQNMFNLFKLLICRDAYWKLSDDWKPGWNGYYGDSGLKYCIFQDGSALRLDDTISRGCVLMFPTKEIRDTFYENFKDLINECKELL